MPDNSVKGDRMLGQWGGASRGSLGVGGNSVKVLDFVQLCGPCVTVLQTFEWVVELPRD